MNLPCPDHGQKANIATRQRAGKTPVKMVAKNEVKTHIKWAVFPRRFEKRTTVANLTIKHC